MQAFRNPKVALPTVLGAIALVVSFVLTPTPEQTVVVNGLTLHTTPTHTVDWVILALRILGGLSLVIGVASGAAYARGELDMPHEAVPPSQVTHPEPAKEIPPLNVPFSF